MKKNLLFTIFAVAVGMMGCATGPKIQKETGESSNSTSSSNNSKNGTSETSSSSNSSKTGSASLFFNNKGEIVASVDPEGNVTAYSDKTIHTNGTAGIGAGNSGTPCKNPSYNNNNINNAGVGGGSGSTGNNVGYLNQQQMQTQPVLIRTTRSYVTAVR